MRQCEVILIYPLKTYTHEKSIISAHYMGIISCHHLHLIKPNIMKRLHTLKFPTFREFRAWLDKAKARFNSLRLVRMRRPAGEESFRLFTIAF